MPLASDLDAPPLTQQRRRTGGDLPFLLALGIIGATYIILIAAMLIADATFTTPGHLFAAFRSPNIRYAIKLSLISCTIAMLLSVWVAVPIGYLMSRYEFRGKSLIDALLDVPIVLPPLVIGLSLLILFTTAPGRFIERMTEHHMGGLIAYGALPLLIAIAVFASLRRRFPRGAFLTALAAAAVVVIWAGTTGSGQALQAWAQQRFSTRITYAVPSVILAQFSVACAFAVRTMRVTFDQISPRSEQVAMTLGCSRSQAFWLVVLPEAGRGILTAATLAWARSLGEFGPILVFSGATRMHTEVLSTTVFLELSIGALEAAVAVSLWMVIAAFLVLLVVRKLGSTTPFGRGI